MALSQFTNTYKSRFVVKVGEHLRMIGIEEIAKFLSADKSTYIRTLNNFTQPAEAETPGSLRRKYSCKPRENR